MEKNKIYNISGRVFGLKEEFTIDDWDKSKTVDDFFSQIPIEGAKVEFAKNMTKEQFVGLLEAVLIPEDNKPVKKDFYGTIPIPKAMEIFTDFFLVYLRLNIESNLYLTKYEKRMKELLEKQTPSKIK